MARSESAEAYAKLVAAREWLNAITKLLNQLHASSETSKDLVEGFRMQAARHQQLQAEWDEAYSAFEAATKEFSKIVKSLKPRMDSI